ncbi:MAG TPA: hypothetical protein VK922_01070 [Gemmatimonadaceae bacterium]|nr:hypothetical protein [Gemmatimonadaceae bacterium]
MAGTYQVTLNRGRHAYPEPDSLEGVLVLHRGRLPTDVLRQLGGTYYTAKDEQTAGGEACVRWEESYWRPKSVQPRARLYATPWYTGPDGTIELVLRQSLTDRYVVRLIHQDDGRLVGDATWHSMRRDWIPLPSDSLTATRIGDADPDQCSRVREDRAQLPNDSLDPTGPPAAPNRPGLRPGRPAAQFRRYAHTALM